MEEEKRFVYRRSVHAMCSAGEEEGSKFSTHIRPDNSKLVLFRRLLLSSKTPGDKYMTQQTNKRIALAFMWSDRRARVHRLFFLFRTNGDVPRVPTP